MTCQTNTLRSLQPPPLTMPAAKNASHPPYADMVKAAILALKDRSGSSSPAIFKVRQAQSCAAAQRARV